MVQGRNFKDCQVFIYDFYTTKKIAKTKILEYSKTHISMQVNLRDFTDEPSDKVTMIIVEDSLVYEFSGTVHKSSRPDIIEIALFKGKNIENRTTKRFDFNTKGDASRLIVGGKIVELKNMPLVEIVNISTRGILVKASPLRFNINTKFQITLNLGEKENIFNVKVVRLNRLNENVTEYGCIFF